MKPLILKTVRPFFLFVILISFNQNETSASPYGAFDLRMDDLLAQRSNVTTPSETQPVVAATEKPATAAAVAEAQPDSQGKKVIINNFDFAISNDLNL
jgi:hypothetical protein